MHCNHLIRWCRPGQRVYSTFGSTLPHAANCYVPQVTPFGANSRPAAPCINVSIVFYRALAAETLPGNVSVQTPLTTHPAMLCLCMHLRHFHKITTATYHAVLLLCQQQIHQINLCLLCSCACKASTQSIRHLQHVLV